MRAAGPILSTILSPSFVPDFGGIEDRVDGSGSGRAGIVDDAVAVFLFAVLEVEIVGVDE